jgi:hypothetical protein
MTRALCLLALAACTTEPVSDVPRSEACQQQATAWCDVVAPRAPGCPIIYRYWCGSEGSVDRGAQNACLEAVATMERTWDGSYPVPDACQRTWAVP